MQSAEFITPVSIDEAHQLTHEMKRLIVHCETALDQEGIRHQAETLERWMESYRRGLTAACKLSENGPAFLKEMRDKILLALDELSRLEDEGGAPATQEQLEQVEEFHAALRTIDSLIASLEQTALPQLELQAA